MLLTNIEKRLTLYLEYQKFVFEQYDWLCMPFREQMIICNGKLIEFDRRCERLSFNEWLTQNDYSELVDDKDIKLNLNPYVIKHYTYHKPYYIKK